MKVSKSKTMKLTKDEAKVLAGLIEDSKYDDASKKDTKEAAKLCYETLKYLQCRLRVFAEDKRRLGRVSDTSYSGALNRLMEAHKNNKALDHPPCELQ